MHILKQSIISCENAGPTSSHRVRKCWSNMSSSETSQTSAVEMLVQHCITYSGSVGPTSLEVSAFLSLAVRMLDQHRLAASGDVGPTTQDLSFVFKPEANIGLVPTLSSEMTCILQQCIIDNSHHLSSWTMIDDPPALILSHFRIQSL